MKKSDENWRKPVQVGKKWLEKNAERNAREVKARLEAMADLSELADALNFNVERKHNFKMRNVQKFARSYLRKPEK